jgi:hypothetical protein
MTDIKLGRMVTVDSLFDRFFGKATQPTDNKTEVAIKGSVPISKWLEQNIEK